jgi:hypothetical protein
MEKGKNPAMVTILVACGQAQIQRQIMIRTI